MAYIKQHFYIYLSLWTCMCVAHPYLQKNRCPNFEKRTFRTKRVTSQRFNSWNCSHRESWCVSFRWCMDFFFPETFFGNWRFPSGNLTYIAGWKMETWRLFKIGDFPASYVSLPEGIRLEPNIMLICSPVLMEYDYSNSPLNGQNWYISPIWM